MLIPILLCLATLGADPAIKLRYPEKHSLLVVFDTKGNIVPVRNAQDWSRRRSHILDSMQEVMGPLPTKKVPLDVKVLEETAKEKYTLKKITYASEEGDRVPAYLLVPHKIVGKAPAMLCLHQTTAIGKGEPAGLGGLPNLHYAHELALRGYIALAPDYPSFGDYQYDFKKSKHASGTIKGVWNHICAVDLLCAMESVDKEKIGVIGHSLGGHNSLFVAAFDERIKAVITSCGFTSFPRYYNGNIKGWTSDRYMPRLSTVYKLKTEYVPFDFPEILGTIAPRALFINAPMEDSNFEVDGVKECVAAAQGVFRLLNSRTGMQAYYPECKHDFPNEIRRVAYDWLTKAFEN